MPPRPLLAALVACAVVRAGPILAWADRPCVRDECTYRDLASSILRGDGMVGTRGWLWAPGYPGAIALHTWLFERFNAVKWTQLGAAVLTCWLLWRLARAQFGDRAAAIAAFLFALNPTHAFYASSWWSEAFYTALLVGLVAAVGWARGESAGTASAETRQAGPEPRWNRGLAVGALLGACVLFRGIATYLLPCVALGLLWERARSVAAWRTVGAMALAAALVVAPYSAWATQRFGGLVVSDRTLGQMMWLGDNDFLPVSFDYGSGIDNDREFDLVTARGRAHCPFPDDPVQQDDCERAQGLIWIRAHPAEFVMRMPLRVSQMLTPHSLLTRNLRNGKWRGLPPWVDEAVIGSIVGFSFVTVLGGTAGAASRGRGWYLALSGAIVGYHVAAIACLAGLSRYRVPLEPLWMVFAGALLSDPPGAWAHLKASRLRLAAAVALSLVVLVLMLRFLPAGWPGWKRW